MARHFQTFRTAGSGHYAELCADETPAAPPARALPAPGAAHYRRLAADKRREAESIRRHIRTNDLSPAAAFARRQVRELLDQADAYETLAEEGAA